MAEQLTVYQQNLKKKTIQMKAMASELNMYQAQVTVFLFVKVFEFLILTDHLSGE